MWFIYQKTDLKVVGTSVHYEPDLDKGTALQQVVSGLMNPSPLEDYDAVQVTDLEKAMFYMGSFDRLTISKGKNGEPQLAIEEPAFLQLTSDASDVHPVDGISEIPADGTSFTTITVRKIDGQGNPLQGKKDNDLLYLRTDHGTIFNGDGTAEISSVRLEKGQASIRLVSEKARRVATVQFFNANLNLADAFIKIEFI